ncbi:MAG: Na(+)/H(+) antiporter subunit D [Candidatus Hydrothermarchaeales archaeon]
MKPLILPALIYFFGACLILLTKGKVKKAVLLLTPLLALIEILMIKAPLTGWQFSYLDFQITLFYADKLSMLMGYIFTIIGFLCVLYSLHVEEDLHHIISFLYVGAALGVVYAGDLFSFLVFWEILAICGAGLVMVKRDAEALAAGFRYLIMHLIGGAVLMAGILVHYASTNSITMGPVEGGIATALVLFGIGLNAAFIPIHTWLSDAYPAAPITGSIFLSVFTTKSGVYALARTAHGPSMFVAYMGGLMAVYGVTFALMQGNGRKLLSYHVISQVGYMVAGVGIGTALGVNGGFFHLLNNILYKSLLFMCIGAVIYRTGIEELADLGGLARKMPITTITVVIAAASIAGVPFFNGFNSKGLIFAGAHNMQGLYILLELAAVGTFLSFCKFTYFGFLRKREVELDVSDPPWHMSLAMLIVAFMCFFIGIYPKSVTFILPFDTPFAYYEVGHLFGSFLLLGVAAIIFWDRRELFVPHKWVILDFDYFYRKAAAGFMWFCKIPSVRFDSMINRGYGGAGEKMMEIAIPDAKIDEMIDKGYVKTGETLFSAIGPEVKIDTSINNIYKKRGDEFVKIKVPRGAKITKDVDKFYLMSGDVFLKVSGLPEDVQRSVIGGLIKAHKDRFRYLKKPATIFDQSADEFFSSIGEDLIGLLKYPYAVVAGALDFLLGTEEERPSNLHERADKFEKDSIKLLYETPNVSGISVAVVIMVTMISLYLVSIL